MVVWAATGCASNEPQEEASTGIPPDTAAVEDFDAASQPPAPALDDSVDPFFAAVEAKIGFTMAEISEASDSYRVDIVIDCLAGKGYDAPRQDVEAVVLNNSETTLLDIYLAELRGEPVPGALPASLPEEVIAPCASIADAESNPLAVLDSLLQSYVEDISARVLAHPDMQAALATQAACLESRGLSGAPPAPGSAVDERAAATMTRYYGGEISLETARAELEALVPLRQSELRDVELFNECRDPVGRTEVGLVRAEQRSMLDESPGLLDGLADEFAETIAELKGYLPAK